MRATANGQVALLGFGVLATVLVATCSLNQTAGSDGPGTGQATSPAATVTAGSTAAAEPSGAPAAAGGVRKLVASSAVSSELASAFAATHAADEEILVSDLGAPAAVAGSVDYAYDPATHTYWATADFRPTATVSEVTGIHGRHQPRAV